MRICLIALPWSLYRHPSAALGALSAFLKQQEPGFEVICRSDFLDAAVALGFGCYDKISQSSYDVGEMLYAALCFPERKEQVRDFFISRMEESGAPLVGPGSFLDPAIHGESPTWASAFDVIHSRLEAHLERVAEEVAGRYELVGLTTCFGQLFANLALSMRLKRRSPGTRIVLGGSTVSERVGPSLLQELDSFDYVIQGEGEQPLLALARRLASGSSDVSDLKGLISRETASALPRGAPFWEVSDVNSLPISDYSEYAVKAEALNILWLMTVEGSRGCWWDRAKRTGNPKATCHFCNLNVQWNGYREKGAERLVSEVVALNERYHNNVLFFLDNIIRLKGVDDFARRLIDTGKDFVIFYEMRANIRPHELLLLWEAGVRFVQFGIESLSESYLKRIGKGTSVITNLQVMKICHELGIVNGANLLTDFPGGRQEEVEETFATIQRFALAYEPLSANRFWLGRGATVQVLNDEYGIRNLRNADFYRVGLPEPLYERLSLLDLSYDQDTPAADWSSVRVLCKQWGAAYAAARATEYRHLLTYLDSGQSMRIFDARTGVLRNLVLKGLARDVYMFCAEIRRWEELRREFIEPGRADAGQLAELIETWNQQGLLYREGTRLEGGRFLSLAPAFTPEMAVRRIRAAHVAELQRRGAGASEPGPLHPLQQVGDAVSQPVQVKA
ncbi:RiPP maturation radical SAM C-methyltransferase [Vitiosangium sp. GDMCC 1.1324]|uniref:RiPP maturation radical SAM C-methyltransferase n=1 Tax=Vitiosangium sp. (strain GDMCC 1.1324) TaxID=2138576 RepID=UPI000D3CE81F|nr:RiPP maturation radical SAM C-methyltransferase [Vitiosangium sp. GDMCC 1.1324]PTL85816.1 RiPP maturation radical SAM protein 1 [Vitiosangium sp. GDMCC 1.1324]